MAQRILGLIPARGGSKGVPRKNIRLVAGKPLIAYTIEAAKAASDLFFRVIVSTDDEEIATVAREYGADVPFIRPQQLANDSTKMLPVVQHAVHFVERNNGVRLDWVMLLQPTEPFRTREDISAAIALAKEGNCDSVISVKQVFSVHPILMKRIEDGKLQPYCIEEKEGTRRQDYDPPAYMRNGAIYLTRRDVVMDQSSLWGQTIRPYVMPEERSLGVDSEVDLAMIDIMLRQQAINKTD